MVYEHEPLGTRQCPACSFRGVALEFETAEEWRKFARECMETYWKGPRVPAAEDRSGIGGEGPRRSPWLACPECLSPWLKRSPDDPTAALCAVCQWEGPPSTFPDRGAWREELARRSSPSAP